MTFRSITRATAVAATTAAAGALTLLVSGTADAAPGPVTITWDSGADHFTRTITNGAPAAGETITISTQIKRSSTTNEQFDWYKDWHPACLTYVMDSATMTDGSGAHPVEPYLNILSDNIAGDFTATSYKMNASSSQTVTFSAKYTASGADCGSAGAINGGVEYLSTLGHFTFKNLVANGGGTGSATGSAGGVLQSILGGLSSTLGGAK
ncbi:hypothetical protein [Nocardia stercoris]|uniref:Alternate-type signal peptide domain-containing protein n=1 Tax=Nocardia stercoris TaxID=2483361 RepID=A0A3M2KUA8_9NOCA|nr:hypothetical protein [Nocardia stercoris]RMI27823.1 hypothetical protein EBN03_32790 [Nocardia stercoris]